MKTITTHYIDGSFVESHGREVIDSIKPTNRKPIAHPTLADEEDARRAIAAAKQAFASFGQTTKEERVTILRSLHKAVSARGNHLTKIMVEEYGAVVQFAAPIVQAGADVFLAAEKALHELALARSWGKTTATMEPAGVAGLISPWNANAFFLCSLGHHLRGRKGRDQDRQRHGIRPPRVCRRHRHAASTPRRISDPRRPSDNQWLARRSTGALRRI
jgi:aldehyde dehydrogenase (NAD+)